MNEAEMARIFAGQMKEYKVVEATFAELSGLKVRWVLNDTSKEICFQVSHWLKDAPEEIIRCVARRTACSIRGHDQPEIPTLDAWIAENRYKWAPSQ